MAPVVHAIDRHPGLHGLVLLTGQQRTQLDRMMTIFGLKADADLDVMSERQTLPALLAKIVPAAAVALQQLRPDYVLVHGDTLSTFAVALAAFYEGIPVGHVEAGLRSFDLRQPFPEEANRRLTDVLTDLDLPPTPLAKRQLLAEGKGEGAMVRRGRPFLEEEGVMSLLTILEPYLSNLTGYSNLEDRRVQSILIDIHNTVSTWLVTNKRRYNIMDAKRGLVLSQIMNLVEFQFRRSVDGWMVEKTTTNTSVNYTGSIGQEENRQIMSPYEPEPRGFFQKMFNRRG
jgi:UDP-N-acetylglucosamine 2-epimerase